ncbi:UNVERIFIED_CONTAM: hypothetical protein FKN15_069903 [Acipenser sinensis]
MLQQSQCAWEATKELVRLLPNPPPLPCKPTTQWHLKPQFQKKKRCSRWLPDQVDPPGDSPLPLFAGAFRGVTITTDTSPQAVAQVVQEVAVMLQKWAICIADPPNKNRGFYSRLECPIIICIPVHRCNPPGDSGNEGWNTRPPKRAPVNLAFFALQIDSEATRPIVPDYNTDLMALLQNHRHPIDHRGRWCAVNHAFPCIPSLPGRRSTSCVPSPRNPRSRSAVT